jgi:hypothetical protein
LSNKTGDKRKIFITIGQLRQFHSAAAQHLLSPYFGVKEILYDYGLR